MTLVQRLKTFKESNLVSLSKWKQRAEQLNEEQGLSDLYAQLDFSSLVNEAHHVLEELKKNEFQSETAIQCRILLQEFQHRLDNKTGESVATIREQLDSRFLDLIEKA